MPAPTTNPHAIRGERLRPFMPESLAGARQLADVDGAFALGRSYVLDGEFISLDIQAIQNPAQSKKIAARCKNRIEMAGQLACVVDGERRAGATWVLRDQLEVALSAPSLEILAAAARDLDFEGLDRLAASAAQL